MVTTLSCKCCSMQELLPMRKEVSDDSVCRRLITPKVVFMTLLHQGIQPPIPRYSSYINVNIPLRNSSLSSRVPTRPSIHVPREILPIIARSIIRLVKIMLIPLLRAGGRLGIIDMRFWISEFFEFLLRQTL
jgi:hypothetical protein